MALSPKANERYSFCSLLSFRRSLCVLITCTLSHACRPRSCSTFCRLVPDCCVIEISLCTIDPSGSVPCHAPRSRPRLVANIPFDSFPVGLLCLISQQQA